MRSWPVPDIPRLPGTGPVPHLYDTRRGEVYPVTGGQGSVARPVRMYVCGITPYDATHLGHAFTYLTFDLIYRALLDAGREVRYVQNATDVDDPLLERAEQTGEDWRALADRQIQLFRDDMTALRVLPPAHYMGAVEAIPLIAPLVEDLLARGAAYHLEDDVYFAVQSDPHFGEVTGLDLAQMIRLSAERGGDPDRGGKKDPLDPLLWRGARPGEPAWPSPLGPGRPGWHIECVAIALHHLGMAFDIQGGGTDLAFPHHEMGAAHAHVLTRRTPFAAHYAHTGMVGLDGEKMSKSRGNLVFVSRLRERGADPMALRLALLDHHYRTDWEWSDADLGTAARRLDTWRAAVAAPATPPAGGLVAEVRAALADDLDTPAALAAVDRWAAGAVGAVGAARPDGADRGPDPEAPRTVRALTDALLGISLGP